MTGKRIAKPDPRELAKSWVKTPQLSGSPSGAFTFTLINQLGNTLYLGPSPDPRLVEVVQAAMMDAIKGIAPWDPMEGMLAAQLVATHQAVMECYRRAHLPEQSFEGRDVALKHAAKLTRSYAALLEALNRHRGKGPPTVRVEHVTVNAGGQAIVGAVSHEGEGMGEKPAINPMQSSPTSYSRI